MTPVTRDRRLVSRAGIAVTEHTPYGVVFAPLFHHFVLRSLASLAVWLLLFLACFRALRR